MSVIIGRLVDLQIINNKEYLEKSERKIRSSYTVTASRGEILDRYGRQLVANVPVFKLYFNYAYWDKSRQNDVILSLCSLMNEYGDAYVDSLPVSKEQPFVYTESQTSSNYKNMLSFIKTEKLGREASELGAEELIDILSERYKIADSFTPGQKRVIVGVRYEMERRSFSLYNTFTFATNAGIDTVAGIKEQHMEFPGVFVDVSAEREYRTSYAAHILGRVGLIYKEEYETLKQKGYPMDAIVGKDGAEKAFEDWLRGISGKQTVITNTVGTVLQEITTTEPQPGNNCILTIDIGMQQIAEESLAANIEKLKKMGESGLSGGAADIEGGAAVVIDVNTGEILTLASYPTYSLATFSKDYNALLEDSLSPMFNRAISGTYPPGSTFKMVTALAGLEEGVIEPDTIINDTGIYMYYAPQYTPRCWYYKDYGVGHGRVNVSLAIKYSCNYFFYETGRLLGIDRLNRYAKLLGLGQKTGIELSGEAAGILAGPEYRKRTGGAEWQAGETIQAAIGQTSQLFTPLQLAAYVSALVNGGTYYRPHILREVKSYDYSTVVYENKPETVNKISIAPENYKAIMEGMRSVTEDGTASNVFRNFFVTVGGKTGSAQTSADKSAHGVFVAFAPYEKPEIAVCVIGEHAGSGNRMAWVARDIFEYYFSVKEGLASDETENTLLY